MQIEISFRVRNEETGEILGYEKLTDSGWVFCYADAPNTWCNGTYVLELMGGGYMDGMVREQSINRHDKDVIDVYGDDIVFIDNDILNRVANENWTGNPNVRVEIKPNEHQCSWRLFDIAGTVTGNIHRKPILFD